MAISDIGTLRTIDIDHEMRGAYLDYAMSVIVARALPDVRDGLKPVHRRILYAMHSMGLRHDRPHRKSARIVGEVLGKFHPHSDDAVYDAMVRLAQEFSMRCPLVDGQGNFGSIDGDNAAAMRYTEARLSEISAQILVDIDKDTVDFTPNFDESLQEPSVLPAALPNLLINGASGIAVGMATNIPSHNLSEIVDALCFVIDHYHAAEDITLDHLMYFIKGPDFPTGGIIYRYREGKDGHEDIVAKAYAGGKGRLRVQAKVHIEAMSRNRNRLVVTELPYQTNKTRLIERIAEMVRDGKLDGITDLRDESDRQGMRIVIELTRNVDPKEVLEDLYKWTPMQQTFGVNMLALVDGEPRLLSLKRMLTLFVEHRREIVRRRSEYDLARAEQRAHILEGLLIALANLDEVIATIRRSPDTETARTRLMRKFNLSEPQAQAILDMPLKRLSRLEREKLQAEHKELLERIRYLKDLLAHPEKILVVIKEELLSLKEKYGDARRTQIVDVMGTALTTSELLPDEDVLVMLTKKGLLFHQSLAGRRRGSLPRRVADAPIAMASAPAHHSLFLFTASGQATQKRIHQIPNEDGSHFADLTDLQSDDDVTTMLALAPPEKDEELQDQNIFLVTKEGRCKRIAVSELWASAHSSPIVMNIEPDDALIGAFLCDSADDVLLVTRLGQSIRFPLEDVRIMGLSAAGVLGIKLSRGDQIVGGGLCKPDHQVLLLTTTAYAMRSLLNTFPTQKRYGSGVVGMRLTRSHGAVESVAIVNDDYEMFAICRTGPMRVLRLEDVTPSNRGGRGRQLPALKDNEIQKLLAIVIPKVKESSNDLPAPPPPPPPPPPAAQSRKRSPRSPATQAKAAKPAQSGRSTENTAAASSKRTASGSTKTTPSSSTRKSTQTTSTDVESAEKRQSRSRPSATTAASESKPTSARQSRSTPSAPRAEDQPSSQKRATTQSNEKPSTSSASSSKPQTKAPPPAQGSEPKATRAQPGSLQSIKNRVKRKGSAASDESVQPKLPLD